MIMLEKIKYYTRMNQYGYESSYASFNNIEFVKNGEYYVNNTYGLLHRYIYEYYNDKIPANHHIHHIDFDKNNNHINNLQMLTKAEHTALHQTGKKFSEEHKQKMAENHADFSGKNHPQYKPRTPEMYEDVKNGMGQTEFKRKYNCSNNYFYNTKKEMEKIC